MDEKREGEGVRTADEEREGTRLGTRDEGCKWEKDTKRILGRVQGGS